jgi:hypothetical protein
MVFARRNSLALTGFGNIPLSDGSTRKRDWTMKNDPESKMLEELRELHEQLTHKINVMDHMRVRQIAIAVDAAGDAAKELTSERRLDIHAAINSRFLPSLNDLDNQLEACQKKIDRLTPAASNLVD